MSDILPVCLQNFLYCRKSELREQIKQIQSNQLSSGVKSAAYSYVTGNYFVIFLLHKKRFARIQPDE